MPVLMYSKTLICVQRLSDRNNSGLYMCYRCFSRNSAAVIFL